LTPSYAVKIRALRGDGVIGVEAQLHPSARDGPVASHGHHHSGAINGEQSRVIGVRETLDVSHRIRAAITSRTSPPSQNFPPSAAKTRTRVSLLSRRTAACRGLSRPEADGVGHVAPGKRDWGGASGPFDSDARRGILNAD
jgi:hypothetical protein